MYSFVFFTQRMVCTDVHLSFILQTHICHFSDELQLEEKRSRRALLALSTVSTMHFVGSNKMYFSVWEVMLQCW